MAAPPIPSKPRLAPLLSFVGFTFGGIGEGLRPLRHNGKADGRFTALTAELFAGNVGAPIHLRGEEQVFARLHSSGNDPARSTASSGRKNHAHSGTKANAQRCGSQSYPGAGSWRYVRLFHSRPAIQLTAVNLSEPFSQKTAARVPPMPRMVGEAKQ